MPSVRRRAKWFTLCLVVSVIVFTLCQHHFHPKTIRESGTPQGRPEKTQGTTEQNRLRNISIAGTAIVKRPSVYSVPWMDEAHWRSAVAPLRDVFVGSRPLFPPCNDSISAGIPYWGKYPYVGPFPYLNASKNPCWFQTGSGLRCVPYFYLAGVSKSGTSDLFARILRHPDLAVAHATSKELHWFDRQRYTRMSFRQYTNRYQVLASLVRRKLSAGDKRCRNIAGDGTPSYFYDSYEWQQFSGNEGCTEPRVIVANQIYHLNPNVKIIFIVRHPVQRLYSRYLFDLGRTRSSGRDMHPDRFHERVVEALAKYRHCFRQWSLRHCVYNKTLNAEVHDMRIAENMYSVLLEDWLRILPRNQMLFLRFEDYAKNRTTELKKVFQFLELETTEKNLLSIAGGKVTNKGQYYKAGGMQPKTETVLNEFYEPVIQRFASLLGEEKFLWLD